MTAQYPNEDRHYTHNQGVPALSWVIQHNLEKHPSVTVVDSAGTQVEGHVVHNSVNKATVTFTSQFSGKAYCN